MKEEDSKLFRIIRYLIIPIVVALIAAPFINNLLEHEIKIKESKDFMNKYIKYAKIQIAEGFPDDAIRFCNMAIREYNNLSMTGRDRLRLEYSTAQYISGIAYYNISMCADTPDNLENAVHAFNESLFTDSPLYQEILINLSIAYLDLSRIKNMEDNLNQAKKYIDIFLEISEKNEDYARALAIRGTVFRYLSEVRNKQSELNKSIKDYEGAIKLFEKLNSLDSGKYDIEIGYIRSNLGSSYRFLSEIENPEKNLDKSKDNNSIALQTLSRHPDELGDARNNRGTLYLTYYNNYLTSHPLARVESEQLRYYLVEALDSFNESVYIQNIQNQCSHERIDAMVNMEYANVLLSGSSSSYKNKIKNSIDKYMVLLAKYDKINYPIQYAKISNYLGSAYFYKARISKSEMDLMKSIKYYSESLCIWNVDEYPLYFAETSKNLGLAYNELADGGRSRSSLENAKDAFRNASDIWQSDPCFMEYAYAEYLLGKTYLNIYKIDKEDYLLAIEAQKSFDNSLSFFNAKDYPEMRSNIKKYINETIDPSF